MRNCSNAPLLDQVRSPVDLRALLEAARAQGAKELRAKRIVAVSATGTHVDEGLGVLVPMAARHCVADTSRDTLIRDIDQLAFPHEILSGRRIRTLRLDERFPASPGGRREPVIRLELAMPLPRSPPGLV